MTEQQALEIIDNYYSNVDFNNIDNVYSSVVVFKYCINNNKDIELTRLFVDLLQFDYYLAIDLTNYIIRTLSEQYNIVAIHKKDGTYIKSYINN